LAVIIWVPPDGAAGTWHELASKERLLASVGDIEPRFVIYRQLSLSDSKTDLQQIEEDD
jgi:hypothetical protein